MPFDPASLRQSWPMPSRPAPIVTIGAGSVVGDAHFPAFRKAGLPIAGLYDLDRDRAATLAGRFGVPRVYADLAEAAAEPGAVFDVATPPGAHA
ncbi:Gfo/Idh/MocA family oxidoreductase, partial [Oharaeibacter diazotrophicus]